MKAFIPALILLLLSTSLQAQSWHEAVVYLTNGDSVKGQVQASFSEFSESSFVFRNPANGESYVSYSTEAVSSYKQFDPPKNFQSLQASIRHYSKSVVPQDGNPVVETEQIDVFAEVMFQSELITLYSVVDKKGTERFFVNKEGELMELKDKSYKIRNDGKVFIVEDHEYQGQVASLVSDCRITKKSVIYSAKSLIGVFQKYVACKSGNVAFIQKKSTDIFNIGLYGFSGFAPSPGGDPFQILSIGVSGQLLARKNDNRFLWIDLGIVKSKSGSEPRNSFAFENERQFYISIRAGTYFGTRKVQPLVYAGISNYDLKLMVGGGIALSKRLILSESIMLYLRDGSVFVTNLSFYPRFKAK